MKPFVSFSATKLSPRDVEAGYGEYNVSGLKLHDTQADAEVAASRLTIDRAVGYVAQVLGAAKPQTTLTPLASADTAKK